MIKSVILGNKQIEYNLQRKTVKNINLRIKADRTVFVSANPCVSDQAIEEFIISKSEYILKLLSHYEELAKYAAKPKQYIDGETFRILGHDLRLKVIEDKKNNIENDGMYITLFVKNADDLELKKTLMDKWLKLLCKDTIQALCEAVYPKFKKYGVSYPSFRFRNMVSCWGSCQPSKYILTFNYALVEYPVSCIEYVVVHEFTHFLQPNHSCKFYEQLAVFMPDWKERKKMLENGNASVE